MLYDPTQRTVKTNSKTPNFVANLDRRVVKIRSVRKLVRAVEGVCTIRKLHTIQMYRTEMGSPVRHYQLSQSVVLNIA